MLNISFGGFNLTPTNNVYLSGFREMQGAERDLTVLKTIGRGVQVLNSVFEGKIIELTGTLKYDTSDGMILKVREFLKQMSRNGQPLLIENAQGSFAYDGCYVTNTDDMIDMRKLEGQSHVGFRAIILSPKGFARSIGLITETFENITSIPYSGSIEITGDTNPEPIINITLVDASTITDLFFTNQTTNQQISVTGITFADGDVISFDTENKQVLHNNTPIGFDGVFPDFLPGLNNYQVTIAGENGLLIDQSTYNAEVSVYDEKQIAQSFELSGAESISQVGLLVKKVEVPSIESYDNFNDNSFDTSLWTQYGGVNAAEQNGRLEFVTNAPNEIIVRSDQTDFEGLQFDMGQLVNNNQEGETAANNYVKLDNGSLEIKVVIFFSANQHLLYVNGSNVVIVSGNVHNWEFRPVGSNIEVYCDGELKYTTPGLNFAGAGEVTMYCNPHSSTEGYYVDNVYKYGASASNSDITVTIETDAAGEPSGTPVTDGTLTILASEVGDTFTDIIEQFATAPALSGSTVYHLVIKQTGGDPDNYYVFKKKNTDVYADGNLETTIDNAATWTQVTGEDLYFLLWGAFPTSFDLTLVIKYFPSYFNVA